MSGSNIHLNDCEVCATEKSRSLILCGEYCHSKIDEDLSLMSETELSDSCVKLSSSPSSFSEFCTGSPEKLPNDICLAPHSIPHEDSSVKVHASSFAGENTEKKLAAKYENKICWEKSSKHDGFRLKKTKNVFEVIGKGTKLMKIMNFPTVIVKHLSGTFEKSKVYYIILELETEESTRNIPAVMFSNPYANRTTRYGELLPLGLMKNSKSFYLTPLLQRKRFRRVFRSGSSLKIKMFIPGRALDRGDCWDRYDLSKPCLQKLIKEYIWLDIGRMSRHFFHRVIPLKHRIKNSKRMERNKTSLQRKPHDTVVVILEDIEISPESFYRTYLPFITNSKLIVQDSGVEYSRALIPETRSTKLNIDKDIKYSIFNRELLNCQNELDTNWCISVIT